uniref:Tetratricopeptide (TPR) repeat n=1 Tax=Candidatus Kentrum sp. FM TaxID=2126340 RepID=A0A450TM50_9GAMM|nr:MAG: Tetratricopeptide (TPR) repeat [Candidatus Kentron sp. FM]VFJ68758.1 MAG: Tetratricopeptide (TPR) repeat [Candidatus Kentron sp. FM]VFK17523.1 MAG: Tetratricopeptide (TPR) repeat [Candidatus Kentron sp. FM]
MDCSGNAPAPLSDRSNTDSPYWFPITMNAKTVFLSHRRDATGKASARAIERALTQRGYDVFLDVDAMAPGHWAEQLNREVPVRAHFLLLLTPGALDNCADENDWVRQEYQLAVLHGRNIVPVRSEDFDLKAERARCPAAMVGLFERQVATVSHAGFEHDVAELIRRYLPRHQAPSNAPGAERSGPPGASAPTPHNLPARNPHFTGREQLLTDLGRELMENGTAELRGMGGIGKTETARRYAWDHREDYAFIGWLRAEDPAGLAEEFAGLAPLLGLKTEKIAEREIVMGMVRRAIERTGGGLLVFDNVEDAAALSPYLPSDPWPGHILITARDPVPTNRVRAPLKPAPFTVAEAEVFLGQHQDAGRPGSLAELVEELGGLPLALEQARAYMDQLGRNVTHYLELFREHRAALLAHPTATGDEGRTVATTWSLALEGVKEQMPEVGALLNLSAFLAPENIPYRLFTEGAEHLPPDLAARVKDPMAFDQLMGPLHRRALVTADGETLSFHRLVRAVLYDRLPEAERAPWLERAIAVLDAAFPFDQHDPASWPPSGALLPHVNAVWEAAKERAVTGEALGHLLNRAGRYLFQRAEYPRSRALLAASLGVREQLHGEQHAATAESLSDMGLLLDKLGEYPAAEEYCRCALAIRQSVLPEGHPDTATSLNNLAGLLRAQGKHDEARPLHEQALEIRRSVFGEQHPDTAISLGNLAILLQSQGKHDEARPLYEQALEIRRAEFGEEHPDTATSLNNLAGVLQTQGKYDEAKPLYEQALEICRAEFGEGHPTTAASLNNLAELLRAQGKYDEARPLQEQALAIHQAVFGEQHPDTATSLNNLAELLRAQGKYDEARPLQEQALAIRQSVFGEEHPDTAGSLNNLGLLLFEQGRKREAISYLERAVVAHDAVFPGGHPDTLTLLFNLGAACGASWQVKKAREYLGRAREMRAAHPEYQGPGP